MKQCLFTLLALIACARLFGQNEPNISKSKTAISEVQRIVLPKQNNQTLLEEELNRRQPGVPPRFAVSIPVDISPANAGNWEETPDGYSVWRLRIVSEGAKSLNLGFTQYSMPHGGTLLLYSPEGREILGPFTPADNEPHEQLWTPVLKGEELVIEVNLPKENKDQLRLQLSYVNHDFLGFADLLSGSCNLDVICGAADGWSIVDNYRDIIQSVAVIGLGGGTFCTGFLVNNTRHDCTPLFMTANHCGISPNNAPSLVAYWNFQNSTCRQPNSPQSGAPGDGVLNNFNTGAIFRAGYAPSDFTLVEFDDPVSETANAFFAGWDATADSPGDSVICIHHPNTDEKRISFSFQEAYISDYFGYIPNPSGDHVAVPDWDIGTTEGGSSGSPLFNKHKRVVGQLHGGGAACGNNNSDFFGWLHISWEGGGTPDTRLKDWLDPDNTGTLVLDGHAQQQCFYFVKSLQGIQTVCSPADAKYLITVSDNFTDSVWLSLVGLPDSLTAIFSANPMVPGDTVELTLGNTKALPEGQYEFEILGTDSITISGTTLKLLVAKQPPTAPTLLQPANQSEGVSSYPTFTWAGQSFGTFRFQLSADSAFTTLLIDSAGIAQTSFAGSPSLVPQQTYYWRVQSANACGTSDWSLVYSFSVAGIYCASASADDVPILILSEEPNTITSAIEINNGGFVEDINLSALNITHTWVGDLVIELTSPLGTNVTLMANPLDGDCDGENVEVGFDDDAAWPYTVLHTMCNSVPPAINGTFQPLGSLASFNGEPIQGTWTLTVKDVFELDGGSLNSWTLEYCATIPDEVVILAEQQTTETCLTDGLSMKFILGTGFGDNAGIQLSAVGLPPGVQANFAPPSPSPGSTVTMTLTPASSPGQYPITIMATNGADTATYSFLWRVIGPPEAAQLSSPPNEAAGELLSVLLQWVPPTNASSFVVRVATDSNMTNPIVVASVPAPNFTVSGLDFCTTYYWRVETLGDCGFSTSEVWSFSTLDDLSFDVAQDSYIACSSDTLNSQLDAGSCFDDNGVLIDVVGLPANVSMDFSQNPVLPDGESTWTMVLNGTPPGMYTIYLLGNDGNHAAADSFKLEVMSAPFAANLLSPAAMEVLQGPHYNFSWEGGTMVSSYTLQIATDEAFNNIVFEENLASSSLTTNFPLHEYGTSFFWRVIFINDCGESVSSARPFGVEYTATHELLNTQFEIWPNPAAEFFFAKTDRPLDRDVLITLSNVLGQVLQTKTMAKGSTFAMLDLKGTPSGIYLVSFASGNKQFTERLVVHRNN